MKDVMTFLQQGKPDQALARCQEIIKNQADHVEALNLGGIAAFQTGDLEQAATMLRKTLEHSPNDAEVYYNLGLIEAGRKNLNEAAEAFEATITIDPNHAGAYNNLGNVRREQGQLEEAEDSYRHAIKHCPDYHLALENLGTLLLKLDQPDEARDFFVRLLELMPPSAPILSSLGEALKSMGRFDEAASALGEAISLSPENPDFLLDLSIVFMEADQLNDAEAACQSAIGLAPERSDLHFHHGNILYRLGLAEESEASFLRALKIKPDYSDCLKNLGDLFKELGRFDEAKACFRQALEIQPDDLKVFLSLFNIKTITGDDPDLLVMQGFLDKPGISHADQQSLFFNLAKTFDGLGDYDTAFENLRKGNALRRALFDYDVGADIAKMKQTARIFSPDFLSQSAQGGDQSDIPIFIIGMPRSGTTLTEQILAAHPAVHGGGESEHLNQLVSKIRSNKDPGKRYPDWVNDIDAKSLHDIGSAHVEALRLGAGEARRVTDKMPGNFLYLGLIRLALPNAKIIHCIRDPMATCFSCYQKEFASPLEFSWDLTELGQYYRAYHDLMGHLRGVFGDWILDLRYEQLVADQEQETGRLLDFCGLPWDEACLSFYKSNRLVKTSHEVRQPIYNKAVAHWRHYHKYLDPLRGALGPLAPKI